MLLKIDVEHPKGNHLRRAVEELSTGNIIVYPTDTTYGIGCSIFNQKGIKKILALKKFDEKRHLTFICKDIKEASQYAKITDFSYKIMKEYLPGPYTFILKAQPIIPKIMLTKWKTVGIRIPASNICLMLVSLLGHPIVNTTVRLPGEDIICEAYEIEKAIGNKINLILDGGPLYNEPTSVISLVDDNIEIIRKGKGKIDDFI